MKIDNCTLSRINDRSEAILEAYGVVLKRGKGNCPFHQDKKPSFIAKRDKQGKLYWSCQSCGVKGGDILSFVAQMEGKDTKTDFRDIVQIAAKVAGVFISEDDSGATPTATAAQRPTTPTAPPEPPTYIDRAQVESAAAEVERTNLFQYLTTLWAEADVRRVMELYKVGLFREYRTSEGKRRGAGGKLAATPNCSTFPSIDTEGNIHAVKGIPYSTTSHHRVKGVYDTDWHKGENVKGCYFGIHLLPLFPDKPIALVESEKTAIVGTLEFPQYLWIATQSKYRSKVEFCEPLRGRVIHIFPDTDAIPRWEQFCADLQAAGHSARLRVELLGLLPAESKLDICDIIIWNKKRWR